MKVEMLSAFETTGVAVLLNQRFGDGSVYLCYDQDRMMVEKAQRLGLVDEEGFVTPAGRAFPQAVAQ